mmetsp:Transcript_30906/g.87024  ORF Transcript_30906/g.87024 Transcript_30906/m.87024 type:complete len:111 (-) Transcript_30906:11-343(-)
MLGAADSPSPTVGQMLSGSVKTWLEERGMGFIRADAGGTDLFVHRSDLVDGTWLIVGSPVSFEEGFDKVKGKRVAKKVSGAAAAQGKGRAGCGGGPAGLPVPLAGDGGGG